MQKTKVNVSESIKTMDTALNKLEEGFIDADLNKEEAADIVKQLEEVVALAERIKADIQKD